MVPGAGDALAAGGDGVHRRRPVPARDGPHGVRELSEETAALDGVGIVQWDRAVEHQTGQDLGDDIDSGDRLADRRQDLFGQYFDEGPQPAGAPMILQQVPHRGAGLVPVRARRDFVGERDRVSAPVEPLGVGARPARRS
jgi:hypothetical protein